MSEVRRLPEPLTAYRIGDAKGEFPIWDDGGARKGAGRWHTVGLGVIYASEHYSTAMLEKLAHHNGELPANQHFIEISIPAAISYEVVNTDHFPAWADMRGESASKYGSSWYSEKRSVVLIVPSVVARMERNFIFNTSHEDFKQIKVGLETPIWWDNRLFD